MNEQTNKWVNKEMNERKQNRFDEYVEKTISPN